MKLSYSQMVDLTGMTYRTIKKRLYEADVEPVSKEGKSIMFNSHDALRVLFCSKGSGKEIDLSKERALEARERRRKLERENAIEEKLVAPLSELTKVLENVAAQCVPILESIPLEIKKRFPEVTGDQLALVRSAIVDCRNLIADIQFEP